jgi:hypothetical protein
MKTQGYGPKQRWYGLYDLVNPTRKSIPHFLRALRIPGGFPFRRLYSAYSVSSCSIFLISRGTGTIEYTESTEELRRPFSLRESDAQTSPPARFAFLLPQFFPAVSFSRLQNLLENAWQNRYLAG